MASTTVVSDDSVTTVVSEPPVLRSFSHTFSWSAIFSGALVATAVTFFLLALGSGFGLSLVSARHATEESTIRFLSLGAVYFFAAQAFGFAAGGHVAGRLMGPVLENPKEEEFLAGAHGLVTWALAVVATALVIYLAALATGSAAVGGAALGTAARNSQTATPAATGYWVDRLFRPAPQAAHAALGWRQYAQQDNGTATDATPPDATDTESGSSTTGVMLAPAQPAAPKTASRPVPAAPLPPARGEMLSPTPSTVAPAEKPVTALSTTPAPGNFASDKAEAGRILEVGMANGGSLSDVDRAELAHLVAQDTGQTEDGAMRRVQNVEQQMRAAEVRTAETARKVAAYASLWTALALLFGAVVTVMSSVSARWEDDRVTFGLLSRG